MTRSSDDTRKKVEKNTEVTHDASGKQNDAVTHDTWTKM